VEKNFNLFIRDDLDRIASAEVEQMLTQLPSWRREKALRFKHEQGRKECACAYLLLCHALREVYGISEQPSFIIGEHGKPELSFDSQQLTVNSQIFFNLSHCKNAIACVVADRPVGVDVESIGRYNESLARHVLNDQEFSLVQQASNPQLAFIRYWTQKEAIVKYTGRGIDDDLKNLLIKYNNVYLHTEEHLDKGYVVTVAQEA
jgi:4'-phosphopantetheinyl transferase